MGDVDYAKHDPLPRRRCVRAFGFSTAGRSGAISIDFLATMDRYGPSRDHRAAQAGHRVIGAIDPARKR